MSEIALTLSQISNVMFRARFAHVTHNFTGAHLAANFDDPDSRHPSIFGAEHK